MKRDPVPSPVPKPLSVSLSYRQPEKKALPVIKQPEPGPALEKPLHPATPIPKERVVPIKEVPNRATVRQIKPVPLPETAPESEEKISKETPAEKNDQEPKRILPAGSPVPKDIPMEERRAINNEQVLSPPVPAPVPEPPVLKEAVPVYSKNPLPQYPARARRRGQEGLVLLEVLVNSQGIVDDLHISKTSGHNVLDQAAMDAVKNWLFDPGKRGEESVDMWVQVPVRFELK